MKMKEKIKEDILFLTPPYTRNNDIILKVCKGAELLTTCYDLDEIVKFAKSHKLIYKYTCARFDELKNTNVYRLYFINGDYTLDELIELGYSFKEINKILKQQEETL